MCSWFDRQRDAFSGFVAPLRCCRSAPWPWSIGESSFEDAHITLTFFFQTMVLIRILQTLVC